MLFTKLKQISQASLKSKVKTCVISCPTFFTNVERLILLDAARIAGLKVLRLINETTATALAYGFYRNDMFTEKPHNVIFVDFGHSSLQVSACCFTKDNLKMLASAWDQIGGRDFDKALADHFCISMQGRAPGRFKINPKSNARAYLRLLTAVEKLKKEMSITTTKLPLNIDNDDMDIGASMQQSEMKQICAKILQRVEQTFRRLLKESRLQLNQISALELVGGSSRIPAVKLIAEKVFKISATTRLNQDEAVSRGAAIQCAMLCPTVRVRQFSITDTLNFDVYLLWNDGLSSGKIPVFDKFHESPFTRSVTIKCRIPFTVCLTYADRNMGVFTFGDHVENNEVKKESELLNRLIDSVLKPQKYCIKKWLPSICAAPSATQKI
ncbi:uncharacterized protein Dwil_GK11002 [Drosophila willistoni]|uniref:Heat shock 70 kDa protein 4L n=1 Tax=Drosophila willistoni TaxID=7260 RepID=B4N8N2_DROWI|nr:uncharacterized protein Dwil_GK11002 [Drosophila willistoni]